MKLYLGGPVQKLGTLSINNLPRMMQYGIVSGGINSCGQVESQPGVYVKVSEYIDWILENVETLESKKNNIQGKMCSLADFAALANSDGYGNRIDANLLKSLAG